MDELHMHTFVHLFLEVEESNRIIGTAHGERTSVDTAWSYGN